MTVIARIIGNALPMFVGDVLLSSKQSPLNRPSLPTATDVNRFLPSTARTYVVGMTQKVNILDDRFVIAWAGHEGQAKSLCRAVQLAFQDGASAKDLLELVEAERPAYRNQVALMGSIMVPDAQQVRFEHFQYRAQRADVPDLDIGVAGTGTMPLVRMMAQMGKFYWSGSARTGEDFLNLGRLIYGSLVGNDHATGQGLVEAWGGGFEITLPMGTAGQFKFQKQSIGLHLPMEIVERDGRLMLTAIPRIMKYAYENDVLIIRTLDMMSGESASLTVDLITPLLSEDVLQRQLEHEWACDFTHSHLLCHIRAPEGRFLQFCKFDPKGLDEVSVDTAQSAFTIRHSLFYELAQTASEVLGDEVRVC